MPVDVPRLFNLFITGLKLRPSPALQPDFIYAIQPTFEISPFISAFTTFVSTRIAKDLSPVGAVWTEYFKVPDGKVWLIDLLAREGTAAATSMQHRTNDVLRSYLSVNGTGEARVILGGLWIAGPGEQFGMPSTGNAGDASISCSIHYREIDRV